MLILPKAEGFNSQPLAFLLVLVGPSPFSTIMVSPYSPTAVCNVCIIIRLFFYIPQLCGLNESAFFFFQNGLFYDKRNM